MAWVAAVQPARVLRPCESRDDTAMRCGWPAWANSLKPVWTTSGSGLSVAKLWMPSGRGRVLFFQEWDHHESSTSSRNRFTGAVHGDVASIVAAGRRG